MIAYLRGKRPEVLMSLSWEPEAAVGRPALRGAWLRRLLILFGWRKVEAIPVVHSGTDDADAFDGFHYPNRMDPLSKSELQIMTFLALGM